MKGSPVNSWKGAARGTVNALVIYVHFLRQQRPCVLHYSASRGPCSAGPLVESRDYLKKKGGGIYLSPSCFLCSLHI